MSKNILAVSHPDRERPSILLMVSYDTIFVQTRTSEIKSQSICLFSRPIEVLFDLLFGTIHSLRVISGRGRTRKEMLPIGDVARLSIEAERLIFRIVVTRMWSPANDNFIVDLV